MTKYRCECDRIEEENRKLRKKINKMRYNFKKKCEGCEHKRTLDCKACQEYQ